MPRINPNAPSKIDARLRKIARDFAKTDGKIEETNKTTTDIIKGGFDDIQISIKDVGIKIGTVVSGIEVLKPITGIEGNLKYVLNNDFKPILTGIRDRIPTGLGNTLVQINDNLTGAAGNIVNIKDTIGKEFTGLGNRFDTVDRNLTTIKDTDLPNIKSTVDTVKGNLTSAETNITKVIKDKTFNVDLTPVTKELTNIKNLFPDNFKTSFSTMASQATESHSFLMGAETSTGSFKNYVNNLRLNNDTFVEAANANINELNSVNASQRLQITSLNNRITSLNQTIDDLRYQLEEMRPTGGGGQTIPTGGVTIPTGGVIPGGGGGSHIM